MDALTGSGHDDNDKDQLVEESESKRLKQDGDESNAGSAAAADSDDAVKMLQGHQSNNSFDIVVEKEDMLARSTSSSSTSESSITVYHQPMADPKENPLPQIAPQRAISLANGETLILVMVGLPGMGKTYIARRLRQYLKFFHGVQCELFNLGNYRRNIMGPNTPSGWFDPNNADAMNMRMQIEQKCMDALKSWLVKDNEETASTHISAPKVGIYDAANTTKAKRRWILEQLAPFVDSKRQVVFIESICKDTDLIERSLRAVKLKMPDYTGIPHEKAMDDFNQRVEYYRSNYESVSTNCTENNDLTWIRVTDIGKSITVHRVRGYIPGRIIHFLTSLHISNRSIYLARHGESEYNAVGKIGGDSSLSKEGDKFARELAKFAHKEILGINEDGTIPTSNESVSSSTSSTKSSENDPAKLHSRLMTSSLKRCVETAKYIQHPVLSDGWVVMRQRTWRNLDELYAGVFDGMTYDEIAQVAPEQFAERQKEKLTYRYPRGESYLDVIERLDPIVHELERCYNNVLVIGHQGTLRILYAYFKGLDREQAPLVSFPLNTVVKLTPQTYECEEERFQLIGETEYDPHSH